MRGARVWLTVVWLLSGCDVVFQLSPRVPDAASDAGFDTALCPSAYSVELANQRSRYRVIKAANAMWSHSDDCDNDRPGATHLAALDDLEEIAAVQAHLDTLPDQPSTRTWVGAVQRSTAVAPDDAWITIGDVDLPAYWCPPAEPNDGGSSIERGIEQFVSLERNSECFIDAPGIESLGGLCECDGKPRGASATELIETYRAR